MSVVTVNIRARDDRSAVIDRVPADFSPGEHEVVLLSPTVPSDLDSDVVIPNEGFAQDEHRRRGAALKEWFLALADVTTSASDDRDDLYGRDRL
jgi:hypothetical protein